MYTLIFGQRKFIEFSREQVEQLDENKQLSRALDGSDYLPGMVALNNIKETDFVNLTIQSLMRVTPLRNFFLIPKNYQHSKSSLFNRFGELTRKIWHARNFKGQVSPHEFLQAVMNFEYGVCITTIHNYSTLTLMPKLTKVHRIHQVYHSSFTVDTYSLELTDAFYLRQTMLNLPWSSSLMSSGLQHVLVSSEMYSTE